MAQENCNFLRRFDRFFDYYRLDNNKLPIHGDGEVYRCTCMATNKEFAVKMLLDNYSRALTEVEFHMKISKDCDYIVKIHEVFDNAFSQVFDLSQCNLSSTELEEKNKCRGLIVVMEM